MQPLPPPRRAGRPVDRRIVSGVAAGVAEHLGVDALWVRLAFTVAAMFNGVGIIAYLLLWRFLPLSLPERSPGLDAATRLGMRSGSGPSVTELLRTVAVLALGLGAGLALQLSGNGLGWGLLVPLGAAGLGLGFIWRGLDDRSAGRLGRPNAWRTAVRIGSGAALVAVAGAYLVTVERGWSALADVGTVLVVAVLGVALILGPWIASLISDLSTERRERVRSQERADVAAHLHDSVLQTLALLRKNAADPALVATLARRQERDLRAWLYGEDHGVGDTLAAAIRSAAAEVEADHRVAVEVIAVGDAPMDADLIALVRAARESMVNAAKHADVDSIDVYAESTEQQVEVFVRDRGRGFDPDTVGEDRMGLRGSIVDRVERHGGTAAVRSRPGAGTEISLSMPRQPTVQEEHQ